MPTPSFSLSYGHLSSVKASDRLAWGTASHRAGTGMLVTVTLLHTPPLSPHQTQLILKKK